MAQAVLDGQIALGLRQVEEGLLTLRRGAYFTEDEWIKLDGLIHKGQYVFTTGPPRYLAPGSPLLRHAELYDAKEVASIEAIEARKADAPRGSSAVNRSDSYRFLTQNLLAVSESSHSGETELVKLHDSPTKANRDISIERLGRARVTVQETLGFAEVERPKSGLPNGSSTSQKRPTSKLSTPLVAPKSQTSVRPASQAPMSRSPDVTPELLNGRSFVVRIPLTSNKANRLAAAEGDRMKVLQDVGEAHYRCLNLRTKVAGLVSANYVRTELGVKVIRGRRPAEVALSAKDTEKTRFAIRSKEAAGNSGGYSTQKSRAIFELDNIEELSAAEWEVDRPSRPDVWSPATRRLSSADGSSSFSVGSNDRKEPESGSTDHETSILDRSIKPGTFEEMERFFDSKAPTLPQAGKQQARNSPFPKFLITKANKSGTTTPGSVMAKSPASEPLDRPICAFWADPGRTCRYTDEACPNQHALPNGRRAPSSSRSVVSPTFSHKEQSERSKSPRTTCVWWANGKGCRYADDECCNLHGYPDPPHDASDADAPAAGKEITHHYWEDPATGWNDSSEAGAQEQW